MSSRIIYIDGKRIIDRVRSGVWLFNYSEPPVAEEAFFDRMRISLHGRIEYPSWDLFEDYIGHLYNRGNHGVFRVEPTRNPRKRKLIPKRHDWLISGRDSGGTIYASTMSGPGTANIHLELSVNPTRFYANNVEDLEELAALSPQTTFSVNRELQQQTQNATLDGNDNFLLSLPRNGGISFAGPENLSNRALEIFFNQFRALIDSQLVPSETNDFAGLTIFRDLSVTLNWDNLVIQQCEVYWDFEAPDALSRVNDLNRTIGAIAQSFETTSYDQRTEGEHNALSIQVPLTQNVQAVFYAKTHHRIRVEVKHFKNVRQTCQIPPPRNYGLFELLCHVRQDAADRMRLIFESLAAQEISEEPSTEANARTLAEIAAVSGGEVEDHQLLFSVLLSRGGISEIGDSRVQEALPRLQQAHLLRRVRTRHGGVPRYVFTPNAHAALEVAVRTIRYLAATPDSRQPPRSRSVH